MYDLIFLLVLLAVGYSAGTWAEKKHYASIEKRERETLHLPAVTLRNPPHQSNAVENAELVYGSVVISIDYFKKMLAGLRNIFGGPVKSYETLVDRARREAVLRMKEMAGDAGSIINVRIETSAIGFTSGKKGVGSIEVIAYGTALKLNSRPRER